MVKLDVINKAREFHGHICPFLVLGLRASEIALSKMNLRKASVSESIGEDIIAIVENNSCFADGVQVATGCTLGNNALIYLDTGKTAVSLFRRGEKRGIRVYVDGESILNEHLSPEAKELFQKVIVERRGNKEDVEMLDRFWSEIGLRMADLPEEKFVIQEVWLESDIEQAPIFPSVKCSVCGEKVWAPKTVSINGRPVCFQCAGREALAVVGRGISPLKVPFKVVRKWE